MEITLIIFGVFILLSFILGLKYGYKITEKEEITLHENKTEVINDKSENEKIDKEVQTLLQVIENVEAYDGTEKKQKKIEGDI